MPRTVPITQHPMKPIVDAWLEKIRLALEVREEKFGKYAREISRFYDGPHDFMWNENYSKTPGGFLSKEGATLPTFRVTINNVFKAVALFGPSLYHQNPNIQVSPILPAEIPPEALGIDPADPYGMQEYQMLAMEEQQRFRTKQACAAVKTQYINWVQQETDKKTHSRRAIQEAIVTGLGYLETTVFTPPASQIVMPRSTYVSWCDVVVDPDASYWEDVQWIGIRRNRPVNLTERRFGKEPGELKGNYQSFASQTSKRGKKEANNNRGGKSFDLCEYWEVFSKNGFGDRLHNEVERQHKFDYSVLGDYCWLAVADGIPCPLNMPSKITDEMSAEELFERAQWPIPFWNDSEGWSISRLTFYEKENEVWPISLFKPAIGEMRFINWCMSFLADKVASSCTTYVGMMKAAGNEIKKQIGGINCPFTIIEIAEALGKNLNEVITFLQAPNFPADIWKMLAEVTAEIDEKTGVTELLQGLSNRSMRSAAEANIKNERVSVRPDDMAARAEDFYSEVAVREIQAARWFCEGKDVEPVLGRMGAHFWEQYILTGDPDDIVRNFNYTIEAGSARKPNLQTKIEKLTELAQYGKIPDFAIAGQIGPYNAWITEWCRAMQIDPQPFLLQPPDPNQPSPEEQEVQAEIQIKVAELELEMQKMQAELGFKKEEQDQELKHEQEMHQLEMTQKREETKLKAQESKARQQATKIAAKNKPKAGAKK